MIDSVMGSSILAPFFSNNWNVQTMTLWAVLSKFVLILYIYLYRNRKKQSTCLDLVVHSKFLWQLKVKPISKRKAADLLPEEIRKIIISYFDAEMLNVASCVSKKWLFHCYNEAIWYRLCLKQFSVDPDSLIGVKSKVVCSRTLYKLLYQGQRRALNDS
mmetsp:Transcript_13113/g.21264  ORF Transcript_13113/g.21264 Transcript_13113/m.21264 type:complete len:159 (-) Transcript_13113:75-551(-)